MISDTGVELSPLEEMAAPGKDTLNLSTTGQPGGVCALCGSARSRLYYKGTVDSANPIHPEEFACTSPFLAQYGDIHQCLNCTMIYAEPPMEEDSIVDNYGEVVDQQYLQELEQRRYMFERILDKLERKMGIDPKTPGRENGRGRLLELGAHVGVFLDVARKRGWDAHGVEPSRWACEFAKREFGVDNFPGTLDQAGFADESFDVVVLWDVLEHFADPVRELQAARSKLKKGGTLALTTINIASLTGRLMGRRWPWIMRMHLFYFTPRTLRQTVTKGGFNVISFSTEGKVFRLSYLFTRLSKFNAFIFTPLEQLFRRLSFLDLRISINTGDIVYVIAKRLG